MSTTVLLVDDHELIRQGLARAFERDDDMTVVGQAGNVAEGVSGLGRACSRTSSSPTSSCPTGTASTWCAPFARSSDTVGLVVLTMHAGDDQIFAAMEAGASAFVGKDSKADRRRQRGQARGRRAAHVPVRRAERSDDAPRHRPRHPRSSPAREEEVLALLADGLGTGEIAARLYLSESTAKTHITHIYQKLGAANRAQALVTAMRMGLLDHPLAQRF